MRSRSGEDPGALSVLRAYERWRKSEIALMSSAIDAFNRFLAHGDGPLSRLAQRALGWVNRSAELKRFFIAPRAGRERGTARPRQLRPPTAQCGIWSIFAAQMKSFSESP